MELVAHNLPSGPAAFLMKSRGRSAFTLLEVVLAIVIAVGMLLVVLFFYQQAADLRGQLLVEAERLSVARLLMDRITGELRTTRRHSFFQGAFIGESDFIQFIKTDFPSHAPWNGGSLGRAVAVETDLKLVSYRFASAQGTNAAGLARSEETLLEATQPRGVPESSGEQSALVASQILTDTIQLVRFRYWDGKSWINSWSGSELPRGVEVTLGLEPLPSDKDLSEYPAELFRRVICLPESALENQPMVRSASRSVPTVAEARR